MHAVEVKEVSVADIHSGLHDMSGWQVEPFQGVDGEEEAECLDLAIKEDRLDARLHEDKLVVWKLGDDYAYPGDWIVWEEGSTELYFVPGRVFGLLFDYRPN